MRSIYSVLLVFLALPTNGFAASFSDLQGWKYVTAKEEPGLMDLLGSDIQGAILEENAKDSAPPTVVVYQKPLSGAKMSRVEDWRKLIPFKDGFDTKKDSVKDRTYQANGQQRYFGELTSDVGLSNMMPAAVFGMVSDGKIYLFVYENSRDAYHRNVKDVVALFHQISASAKN